MKYLVKNRMPYDVWVNLPDPEKEGRLLRGLRLPPRGTVQLDEEEYHSADVQAKLREGLLVLLKEIA